MSVIEKKLVHLNIPDVKMQKIVPNKISITPKKINLCKKYFYINNKKGLNLRQFNNGKLLQINENNNKLEKTDVLEQLDYIMTQFERKKIELNRSKVDCIKSMILNNKRIPEKWIMKPNYRDLLNEAMEDEMVLNYAIVCQDIYKKTAGMDQSDESRFLNYKKSLPKEKIFVSYINPYSRNYLDSAKKKKVMSDYCLSLRKNHNTFKRNKYNYNNSLNNYEKNINLYKKINKRNNSFGDIPIENNKLPLIKNKGKEDNKQNNNNKRKINNRYNKMSETRDDLMVTSLYYSGYENNDIKNNNPKKDLKLPELPLIY